jgi:hypothetical protein
MSTITLELPEDLAAAVATPEGMRRVREMIEAEFGGQDLPLNPELLARGKRGATDLAEGRFSSLAESQARAEAALEEQIAKVATAS